MKNNTVTFEPSNVHQGYYVYINGQETEILDIAKKLYHNHLTPETAINLLLDLFSASKRYFLFECVNADKQKLNKLIIANDKENAILDIETSYPYIERWYTIEELNVC